MWRWLVQSGSERDSERRSGPTKATAASMPKVCGMWKPISEFDQQLHPAISGRFLIAGTHPNGVKWSDACYWDGRGWFSGHRLDDIEFWQFMPEHPAHPESVNWNHCGALPQRGTDAILQDVGLSRGVIGALAAITAEGLLPSVRHGATFSWRESVALCVPAFISSRGLHALGRSRSAYVRFRFGQWERVCSHCRSWPKR